MAASLAWGLWGIEERTPGGGGRQRQGAGTSRRSSLVGASHGLERCQPLQASMGTRFCDANVWVTRREYETFSRVIGPWVREFLLLHV